MAGGTSNSRIKLRIYPRALLAFKRRVALTRFKPSQVVRALLRSYAEGGAPPQGALLNEEELWERSKPGQSAESLRSQTVYFRVPPELTERVRRRAGEAPLSAVVRALMREFAEGQRELSDLSLERERVQERTRRKTSRI